LETNHVLQLFSHFIPSLVTLHTKNTPSLKVVAGSFTAGFRDMFSVYILEALANIDHGYVYLFILFMAGLVGLIEKSGGLAGVTIALRKYVKTPFTAQLTTLCAGLIIFFDDYSNTLVAGSSMRPLTDACVVSREKLAFIVDATSAPIASLTPISSWIGFEIGLIQTELDVIKEMYPESTFASTSSFTVFVKTIQYRYYCIFML
jgi:Na+/H+ antiporter NhaC